MGRNDGILGRAFWGGHFGEDRAPRHLPSDNFPALLQKTRFEPHTTSRARSNNCSGGHGEQADGPAHCPRQEGFCLPSTSNGLRLARRHPIRPRAPAPGPLPARGTICPPHVCYLISPPPPRNPSKTITLKSTAWHLSRFYFSSFSGKLNPLWHRQPAQLFQQRKHPQFREEEIMTNLCKIKTRNMCVCVHL